MSATRRTCPGGKLIPVGRRKVLEYYEFGTLERSARPVLFHYGLPGSGYLASLADAVARQLGVRIISPNRPGFGDSTFDPNRRLSDWPAVVTRLLDELGIGRVTAVGVSSGGAYACALGRLCPERVAGIVLLNSLAPVAKPGVTRGMRLLNQLFCILGRRFPPLTDVPLHLLARQYHHDPAGLQRQLLNGLPAEDREVLAHPEVAAAFDRAMEEAFRQGPHGLAHDIRIVTGPWGDLSKVTCPVRIVHGDRDGVAPLAMARYLRSHLPHATLEVVPGAGHLIAADVTGPLREWLARGLLPETRADGYAVAGSRC